MASRAGVDRPLDPCDQPVQCSGGGWANEKSHGGYIWALRCIDHAKRDDWDSVVAPRRAIGGVLFDCGNYETVSSLQALPHGTGMPLKSELSYALD